jgi:hypothetical protein
MKDLPVSVDLTPDGTCRPNHLRLEARTVELLLISDGSHPLSIRCDILPMLTHIIHTPCMRIQFFTRDWHIDPFLQLRITRLVASCGTKSTVGTHFHTRTNVFPPG